eukprot:RCo035055
MIEFSKPRVVFAVFMCILLVSLRPRDRPLVSPVLNVVTRGTSAGRSRLWSQGEATSLTSQMVDFDVLRFPGREKIRPSLVDERMTVKFVEPNVPRDPELFYVFGCQMLKPSNDSFSTELVVMNSTGHLMASKFFPSCRIWTTTLINSSTLYALATESDTDWDWSRMASFLLYNFRTGALTRVPLPGGTHWVDYDEQTQTILWLRNRMHRVDCGVIRKRPSLRCPSLFLQSRIRHNMVITDDIVEQTLDGHVTFEWDVFQRLVRREAREFVFAPMPMRRWKGQHPDYVHANCVFRDKAENVIYLNSLSLSSIFKIDRGTGRLLWVIGRHSKFKMFDVSGREVPTLFHQAHSLNPLGNDTFLIFDNRGGLVAGQESTRLVVFQVSRANRSARVLWEWAPVTAEEVTDFHRVAGGGVHPQLDGGYVGAFGEPMTNHILTVTPGYPSPTLRVEVRRAFVQEVAAFYDRPKLWAIRHGRSAVRLRCLSNLRLLHSTQAELWVQPCGCPSVLWRKCPLGPSGRLPGERVG